MNGNKKFHSADGPAFNPGEVWYGTGGKVKATILRTRRFGPHKWDVEVFYAFRDGSTADKDAWCFQVRYEHQADLHIKMKA